MSEISAAKIPATVITGFLGAGKTTLIRNLLANANGRRIALIINEFGDLGVDGDILKGCGDETCSEDDVIELTNGCICCTVADDFLPAMTAILDKDRRIDHIVIETSGLALPQPLVSAFNWPAIRERVTVDGVVTVVDSRAVAEGRFADDEDAVDAQRAADTALDHESPLEELFEDQLNAADMIILNKSDLLDGAAMEKVEREVSGHLGRAVKLVRAANGVLPADVLLGLASATENEIANRKSHHEIEHEAGEDHDHDDFESFVVEGGTATDPKALAEKLKGVIERHDILRLKGFVSVNGKPMRLLVQAVGSRVDTHYDREWRADEAAATRLVVIGLDGHGPRPDPRRDQRRAGVMHLLLAQKGSISEGGEAIDLGQQPADIVFLSAADTEIAALADALGTLAEPPTLRACKPDAACASDVCGCLCPEDHCRIETRRRAGAGRRKLLALRPGKAACDGGSPWRAPCRAAGR